MKLSARSDKLELIDLGSSYYTEEEYINCLHQLDRIGKYLGGDRATFSAFDKLNQDPKSILDVGCGGGSFTLRLGQRFPNAHVLGIDLSEKAIDIAKGHLKECKPTQTNVHFNKSITPQLNYLPNTFDVITSTLVCHHLSDEELIDFLKRSYQSASQAIILNDLHRSFFAWAGFALIAPCLFPNRLIFHDGLLSIKRAFIKKDWIRFLHAAGIPWERCTLTWHWPFRWTLFIDTRKT